MEKYRNSSATLNTTYPLTNRFLNTGPLYTMCASSNNSPRQGPQLLMNTTSVGTSTQFQFVPARQSSTHFSGPFQFDMGSIAPIFNSVKTFFSNLIRPKVDAQTLSAYDTTEKRMCNSAPNIYNKCIGEFDKSCFVDVTDSGMLEKLSLSTKSFSEYNLPNSVVKSNSCISPKVPENIQKVDIISSLKEAKSPHTTKETETEKQEASVPPVVVKAPPSPVPILQPKLRSNCSVMPNVPTRPRTQRSDGKRKSRKKSTKSGKNKKEKNRHELAQDIHEDVETETETVSADEWEDPLVIISAVKITSIEPSEKITSKVVCFSNDDFPAMAECSSSSNAKNNSANKQTWELPRLSHCFSTLNGKKQRQISECDSEDSFIVFDNSDKLTPSSVDSNQSICDRIRSTLSVRRQRQLSESSDDDFICFELENSDADCDTDDDHDDDDDDDCDGQPTSDSDCESEVDVKSCGTNPPDSGFEDKKVRFNLVPVVHVLRTWSFAYQQARKGEWEQIGRDRVRFHERVKRMEPILFPALELDHRQKIYSERFSNNIGCCDSK